MSRHTLAVGSCGGVSGPSGEEEEEGVGGSPGLGPNGARGSESLGSELLVSVPWVGTLGHLVAGSSVGGSGSLILLRPEPT